MLLHEPAPQPAPTPVPAPTVVPFKPEEGLTATPPFEKLNKPDDPNLPDAFRVSRVDSGELLWIQTVEFVKPAPAPPGKAAAPAGTPAQPRPSVGPPDIARLAGIVTPAPGQPGWAQAVAKVNSWTIGQDVYVDVEQDARFPVDLNNRRVIQIFFKGRQAPWKDVRLNLNRMMVRLGYAVVDINAPTSIDVKQWLSDESYAREHRLGLWGMGIVLQGRLPPPPIKGVPQKSTKVTVETGVTGVKPRTRPAKSTKPKTPGGATAPAPGAPAAATAPAAPPAAATNAATNTAAAGP